MLTNSILKSSTSTETTNIVSMNPRDEYEAVNEG